MAVATSKPRDADVYDRLQREKKRQEYGAYSRTARAFGKSHEFVRKVEARFTPTPELAYIPPPDAYPEPVKPATEPLLQLLLEDEPATEVATDLQQVMSPSVQVATHQPATLQLSSVELRFPSEPQQALQLRSSPFPDGRWFAVAGLLVMLDACAVAWKLSVVTGQWWMLAAAIVVSLPFARACTRTLDEAWPLWRWWVVLALLAAFVAVMGYSSYLQP